MSNYTINKDNLGTSLNHDNGGWLAQTVLVFIFSILLLSELDPILSGARYLKYIIPLACLMIWIIFRQFRGAVILSKVTTPFLYLLGYACLQLAVSPQLYGFKDVYFIFTYVAPFLFFNLPVNSKNVDLLFKMFISFFILRSFVSIGEGGLVGRFEGIHSFVFGLFFVYYFSIKRFLVALLSIIFVFLTLKRIVLIACVVSVSIYLLMSIFRSRRFLAVAYFQATILILMLIILFGMGGLDWLIAITFEVSANKLSMGRMVIYGYVIEGILDGSNWFFGHGIGTSYELVAVATNGAEENLHSDILKLFYEGGCMLYILFFALMSRLVNHKSFMYLGYITIIFLTDNVLIYPIVMFTFLYLVMLSEEKVQSQKEVGF